MRQFTRLLTASLVAGALPALTLPALAQAPAYRRVLQDTVSMVRDGDAQRLAGARGLNIVNVTWEDTGRYKGSSVGPNISDMTIQVRYQDPATQRDELFLMPVIRSPNFSDVTADVPLDRFYLLVGNERGEDLRRVSLEEVLADLPSFLHDPSSWKSETRSLLAPRDTHALVSAQAAFLPIPQGGEATFNPVLFNYQSTQGDPAVLTLLVTREGTSATIIDNVRDGFPAGGVWGQRLFFNQDGERASLTGKRLSDFVTEGDDGAPGDPTASAAGEEGLNMVMVIQVPLKQKYPRRHAFAYALESGAVDDQLRRSTRGGSDVENAVIGHGEVEGPFTEIDGLAIERDARFPVRVTVQFYKATSNGVVSEADLDDIKAQIDRVYADADYVGSLVVEDGTERPTEYDGDKQEPAGWWQDFWSRYEANQGISREEALAVIRAIFRPGMVALPYREGPAPR